MLKRKETKRKVELFLDSGAFSAWTQKTEVNIDDYIAFIKKHEKYIAVYSNLDDILDPAITWKNQRTMERAGLKPVPVFHYGEDIKYLKKYLDGDYPYLSLGGMVPISTPKLVHWLDRLFGHYLTDDNGMPKVKVHGFGLTALRLMLRYPWYSVDSTAWVVIGRMGSIYIPKKKNGVWIYDEESWKVTVSSRSPTVGEKGKHINNMRKGERAVLLEYIEEKGYKLGKSRFETVDGEYKLNPNERWADKKPKDPATMRSIEIIDEVGVSNTYQHRDEMNIIYFLDLEKSMTPWPWKFEKTLQKGLF